MKLIGYARVSTEEQGRKGHSLPEQEECIRRHVDSLANHVLLIDMVRESASGGNMNERPKFLEILSRLDKGEADGIVVYNMFRLARSVSDIAHLLDKYFNPRTGEPKNLFSVSERLDLTSPQGRMSVYILATVGQLHRELIVDRAKQTSARLKSQGKRYNAIPQYGFMVNQEDTSRLTISSREQEILAHMKECKEAGASLGEISGSLAEHEMFNRKGNPFTLSSISKLCRRNGFSSRP